MSFILEALRKSENERQRQAGPDFASIPEAVEKRRGSRWPVVVALLALLNGVLLAVVLWPESEEATPAVPAPAAAPRKDPRPVAQPPSATVARPQTAAQPPATPEDSPAAPARSAETAGPGPSSSRTDSAVVQQPAAPSRDIRPLAGEAMPPAQPEETVEPTIAPAAKEAAPTPEPRQRPTVTGTERPAGATEKGDGSSSQAVDGLPTANDLRLQGFLTGPPLRLELHVYYPEPSRRVVFISGNRYREGDRVNGGPAVREIVPEGVVLEERGRRYLLGPD